MVQEKICITVHMLEKFTLIDGITVHSGFGHSSKFEFWLKRFPIDGSVYNKHSR
jgi:hypothetical protein